MPSILPERHTNIIITHTHLPPLCARPTYEAFHSWHPETKWCVYFEIHGSAWRYMVLIYFRTRMPWMALLLLPLLLFGFIFGVVVATHRWNGNWLFLMVSLWFNFCSCNVLAVYITFAEFKLGAARCHVEKQRLCVRQRAAGSMGLVDVKGARCLGTGQPASQRPPPLSRNVWVWEHFTLAFIHIRADTAQHIWAHTLTMMMILVEWIESNLANNTWDTGLCLSKRLFKSDEWTFDYVICAAAMHVAVMCDDEVILNMTGAIDYIAHIKRHNDDIDGQWDCGGQGQWKSLSQHHFVILSNPLYHNNHHLREH